MQPSVFIPVALSAVLALHGKRKRSLSTSGAIAGFAVGNLTFTKGLSYALPLLTFYITGSWLTKFKSKQKKTIEAFYNTTGERSAQQVLSTSIIGALIAVVAHARSLTSPEALHDPLWMAYLAYYACHTGDTWASELGSVLSQGQPILITSGERVPRGTNGAVSSVGLMASLLGGLTLGVCSAFTFSDVFENWRGSLLTVAWCGAFGLGGSLLDSLLGATCQATHYSASRGCIVAATDKTAQRLTGRNILQNEDVNLISSAVCAGLGFLLIR